MSLARNNPSKELRERVIFLLADMLADTLDLYSQCKQAHWNVRGTGFIALHELFDKIANEVNLASDTIAERIMQVGGATSGTVRSSASLTRLKEYPLTLGTSEQHIEALSVALKFFNSLIRHAAEETDESGDMVTTDILVTIARGLEKQLWLVEAHLPIVAEPQLRLSSIKA